VLIISVRPLSEAPEAPARGKWADLITRFKALKAGEAIFLEAENGDRGATVHEQDVKKLLDSVRPTAAKLKGVAVADYDRGGVWVYPKVKIPGADGASARPEGVPGPLDRAAQSAGNR
jgi:hypothetical protein